MLMRGERIQIPLKADHVECWLGSFVFFQWIRASFANKQYTFVIFQGGRDPLIPSRSAHAFPRSSTWDRILLDIFQVHTTWEDMFKYTKMYDIGTRIFDLLLKID